MRAELKVSIAVLSGAVAAIGWSLLLSVVAKPADRAERVRAVATVRGPPAPTPARTFAACLDRGSGEDAQTRRAIAAGLTAAGLKIVKLDIAQPHPLDRSTRLVTREIVVTGEGRHPAEVDGLAELDSRLPGLYAERIDWDVASTGLTVGFRARLICRA